MKSLYNLLAECCAPLFIVTHRNKLLFLRIAKLNLIKLKLNKRSLIVLHSFFSSLTVTVVVLLAVLWDKLANRSLWPAPLAALLVSQL